MQSPDVPVSPPRPKDAPHKQGKILDAARCLFATKGVSAPIDAITCRAGVGIGTLNHHFPAHENLNAELLCNDYQAFHEAPDEELAIEDGHELAEPGLMTQPTL
ncbi:TetR/AcrR family transcriptional regulator [Deinococcus deserti]|uniref:Putative transcriptional regulator, TetR family n=1 Tax=Deinococcus deserti (strain DSM 17065 / CIP 109153 / LMG 22923 / VCD115) TaxID=546414 RepID=C1CUV8_DEIDV|nr:TetR/AcrR family transcriptional regulator [Deinococcus deserti]ACO45975.1 putative transcriptional regulator, TetR family [Deinococcus deserti VCD115]